MEDDWLGWVISGSAVLIITTFLTLFLPIGGSNNSMVGIVPVFGYIIGGAAVTVGIYMYKASRS